MLGLILVMLVYPSLGDYFIYNQDNYSYPFIYDDGQNSLEPAAREDLDWFLITSDIFEYVQSMFSPSDQVARVFTNTNIVPILSNPMMNLKVMMLITSQVEYYDLYSYILDNPLFSSFSTQLDGTFLPSFGALSGSVSKSHCY